MMQNNLCNKIQDLTDAEYKNKDRKWNKNLN